MTLRLAQCTIEIERHCVTTTLPDGKTVLGMAHHDVAYRRTARDHGYGCDVERLNTCHEVGHSLLAHWFGLPACPVFVRVANNIHDANETTQAIEQAVLAIERAANVLGVDLLKVAERWSGK